MGKDLRRQQENIQKPTAAMLRSNAEPSPKRKRKRTRNASVWNDMKNYKDKDRNEWAICNHCDSVFTGSSDSGTTHLRNHLHICLKRKDEINIAGADRNEVKILVQHGGWWIELAPDKFGYVSGISTLMSIPNRIRYTDLRERLCGELKLESDENMKFLYHKEKPVELKGDEDVKVFIEKNSIDIGIKYPLYVTSIWPLPDGESDIIPNGERERQRSALEREVREREARQALEREDRGISTLIREREALQAPNGERQSKASILIEKISKLIRETVGEGEVLQDPWIVDGGLSLEGWLFINTNPRECRRERLIKRISALIREIVGEREESVGEREALKMTI